MECKMNTELRDIDTEGLKHWQAHIEQQENDVKLMAEHFEAEKFTWKSFEEMDAYLAQQDINLAKKRLIQLQREIEIQLNVIQKAQTVIKKYKVNLKSDTVKKVGKPKIAESHKLIVNKFLAQWIHSLMELLEVKNCRKLGEQIDDVTSLNSERNWRRWLNGDAIPTYNSFETLLNLKIVKGKYSKQPLLSIPTTPLAEDLLILIRFI